MKMQITGKSLLAVLIVSLLFIGACGQLGMEDKAQVDVVTGDVSLQRVIQLLNVSEYVVEFSVKGDVAELAFGTDAGMAVPATVAVVNGRAAVENLRVHSYADQLLVTARDSSGRELETFTVALEAKEEFVYSLAGNVNEGLYVFEDDIGYYRYYSMAALNALDIFEASDLIDAADASSDALVVLEVDQVYAFSWDAFNSDGLGAPNLGEGAVPQENILEPGEEPDPDDDELDEELVAQFEAAGAKLADVMPDVVDEDFGLLAEVRTADDYFFSVAWESDNEDVIAIDGTTAAVVRQDEDEVVVLTATLDFKFAIQEDGEDYPRTYEFEVTVTGLPYVEEVVTEVAVDVEFNTDVELPDEVEVLVSDGSTAMVSVLEWACEDYDNTVPDVYTFTGTLDSDTLPEGVTNKDGVEAEAEVTVLMAVVESIEPPVMDPVAYGTTAGDLNLPETVEVTLVNVDDPVAIAVEWDKEDYDGTEVGDYVLPGVLTDLPDYVCEGEEGDHDTEVTVRVDVLKTVFDTVEGGENEITGTVAMKIGDEVRVRAKDQADDTTVKSKALDTRDAFEPEEGAFVDFVLADLEEGYYNVELVVNNDVVEVYGDVLVTTPLNTAYVTNETQLRAAVDDEEIVLIIFQNNISLTSALDIHREVEVNLNGFNLRLHPLTVSGDGVIVRDGGIGFSVTVTGDDVEFRYVNYASAVIVNGDNARFNGGTFSDKVTVNGEGAYFADVTFLDDLNFEQDVTFGRVYVDATLDIRTDPATWITMQDDIRILGSRETILSLRGNVKGETGKEELRGYEGEEAALRLTRMGTTLLDLIVRVLSDVTVEANVLFENVETEVDVDVTSAFTLTMNGYVRGTRTEIQEIAGTGHIHIDAHVSELTLNNGGDIFVLAGSESTFTNIVLGNNVEVKDGAILTLEGIIAAGADVNIIGMTGILSSGSGCTIEISADKDPNRLYDGQVKLTPDLMLNSKGCSLDITANLYDDTLPAGLIIAGGKNKVIFNEDVTVAAGNTVEIREKSHLLVKDSDLTVKGTIFGYFPATDNVTADTFFFGEEAAVVALGEENEEAVARKLTLNGAIEVDGDTTFEDIILNGDVEEIEEDATLTLRGFIETKGANRVIDGDGDVKLTEYLQLRAVGDREDPPATPGDLDILAPLFSVELPHMLTVIGPHTVFMNQDVEVPALNTLYIKNTTGVLGVPAKLEFTSNNTITVKGLVVGYHPSSGKVGGAEAEIQTQGATGTFVFDHEGARAKGLLLTSGADVQVKQDATFEYVQLALANVVVAEDATLTLEDTITASPLNFIGLGRVELTENLILHAVSGSITFTALLASEVLPNNLEITTWESNEVIIKDQDVTVAAGNTLYLNNDDHATEVRNAVLRLEDNNNISIKGTVKGNHLTHEDTHAEIITKGNLKNKGEIHFTGVNAKAENVKLTINPDPIRFIKIYEGTEIEATVFENVELGEDSNIKIQYRKVLEVYKSFLGSGNEISGLAGNWGTVRLMSNAVTREITFGADRKLAVVEFEDGTTLEDKVKFMGVEPDGLVIDAGVTVNIIPCADEDPDGATVTVGDENVVVLTVKGTIDGNLDVDGDINSKIDGKGTIIFDVDGDINSKIDGKGTIIFDGDGATAKDVELATEGSKKVASLVLPIQSGDTGIIVNTNRAVFDNVKLSEDANVRLLKKLELTGNLEIASGATLELYGDLYGSEPYGDEVIFGEGVLRFNERHIRMSNVSLMGIDTVVARSAFFDGVAVVRDAGTYITNVRVRDARTLTLETPIRVSEHAIVEIVGGGIVAGNSVGFDGKGALHIDGTNGLTVRNLIVDTEAENDEDYYDPAVATDIDHPDGQIRRNRTIGANATLENVIFTADAPFTIAHDIKFKGYVHTHDLTLIGGTSGSPLEIELDNDTEWSLYDDVLVRSDESIFDVETDHAPVNVDIIIPATSEMAGNVDINAVDTAPSPHPDHPTYVASVIQFLGASPAGTVADLTFNCLVDLAGLNLTLFDVIFNKLVTISNHVTFNGVELNDNKETLIGSNTITVGPNGLKLGDDQTLVLDQPQSTITAVSGKPIITGGNVISTASTIANVEVNSPLTLSTTAITLKDVITHVVHSEGSSSTAVTVTAIGTWTLRNNVNVTETLILSGSAATIKTCDNIVDRKTFEYTSRGKTVIHTNSALTFEKVELNAELDIQADFTVDNVKFSQSNGNVKLNGHTLTVEGDGLELEADLELNNDPTSGAILTGPSAQQSISLSNSTPQVTGNNKILVTGPTKSAIKFITLDVETNISGTSVTFTGVTIEKDVELSTQNSTPPALTITGKFDGDAKVKSTTSGAIVTATAVDVKGVTFCAAVSPMAINVENSDKSTFTDITLNNRAGYTIDMHIGGHTIFNDVTRTEVGTGGVGGPVTITVGADSGEEDRVLLEVSNGIKGYNTNRTIITNEGENKKRESGVKIHGTEMIRDLTFSQAAAKLLHIEVSENVTFKDIKFVGDTGTTSYCAVTIAPNVTLTLDDEDTIGPLTSTAVQFDTTYEEAYVIWKGSGNNVIVPE